jgi:hypothetical protein
VTGGKAGTTEAPKQINQQINRSIPAMNPMYAIRESSVILFTTIFTFVWLASGNQAGF